MEISESSESANADYTPAVPLEISQEVAEQAGKQGMGGMMRASAVVQKIPCSVKK